MNVSLNIVKVGGHIVEDDLELHNLLDAFSKIEGKKILVLGGGRVATALASQLGITTQMIDGRRVTTEEMLRIVTMVYAGLISKTVVAALQLKGVNAIGLCGADMNLILSQKRPVEPIDYGFVGDVKEVNANGLSTLLDMGSVPVLCPITHDGQGQLLNTNADTIAQEVASALALKYDVTLTFCFEKEGVLLNENDPSSVRRQLRKKDFFVYRKEGRVCGGMIPKLENAFMAIEAGVKKVVITSAQKLGTDSGTTIL
ncbi:MAG: acetylglutamate kinase [Alistipes sp.]|nr:acetylglutamate kinase [Candidatus Alistipes equi]